MKNVIYLLEYTGFLLVELLIRCLPAQGMVQVAEGLGALWYRLDGRRRDRAREGIAVAMRGGLQVEDPEHLIRRTFPSLVRVPLEGIHFRRFFRSARAMHNRCRFLGDWDLLRDDVAAGRGGLFVSGHHGNWEVAAFGLRFLHVPCRVVVRPIQNPFLDRRARGTRSADDQDAAVISKWGAVRDMLRTLKSGRWVAILADQNAGGRGTFVRFFGLEASTYAAPAVLAVRTGLPLYAAACIRLPGPPMRFEMHVARLPTPPADLKEADAAKQYLESFLKHLEAWVARAPDQYNWVHRRWKTRPPGDVPGPEQPGYAVFVPQ